MKACLLLFALLLPGLTGSVHAQSQPLGKVQIDFTFQRLVRIASNQVAVWIEDAQGRYVASVFATRFTAAGGHRRRPDSLPDWVQASGWAAAVPAEVDAVTRPTPKSGPVSLTWDCTDRAGRPVPPGVYTWRVEGSIFWKNRVVWSGTIRLGPQADSSTAQPVFTPADALKAGNMVRGARARFTPR